MLHATPVPMTIDDRHHDAMTRSQRGRASAQVTCVRGADRVAAARRARLVLVAQSDRDHRRGRAGRATSGGRGRPAGPRRAGADLVAVGHHRRRRGRAVRRTPATWWSTARPTPTWTPPRATRSAPTPSTRSGAGQHRAGLCAGRRADDPHLHRLRVQRRFDGAPRPYDIDDADRPAERVRHDQAGRRAGGASPRCPDAHVVRTAWVYTGARHRLRRRHAQAGRRATGPSSVVDDQIGSPTYVGDLVAALLADRRATRRRRRCCTPPTRARPAGSSRRGRCSRASAPTRNGCGRWAPTDIPRPARPARRIRRCPAALSTAAGLTPLRPWREALAAGASRRDPRRRGPLPSTP